VFGLSFFAHILTQQIARTTLTKHLIPFSNYIVQQMGYKSVQTIVNAIRSMAGKSAISGATAMKQLSKILRSNTITTTFTFMAFSIPDTYNIFRKRISSAQYTKNMLSLIGTMATASAGTLGTSLAATKIGAMAGTTISPGIGTLIGISGGVAGGLIGGKVIKMLGNHIKEDDSIILSRLYNGIVVNMIYEYMLTESEVDMLIEKFNVIKPKEFKELFAKVQAVDKQEELIENFIKHYFEEIVKNRTKIPLPKTEDLVDFFQDFSKQVEN